ncbi:GAP family protein [Streptomyces sp. ISL-10]|nr:GAP family protein [Streptomyces sp. ISL-10]
MIFVTTPRAVRVSLAYLLGVAVATTAGVAVTRGIFALLGHAGSASMPSDKGSVETIVQFVLVGLLLIAAVKTYVKRETAEPPKWLGTLMDVGPSRAFWIALVVILLMPSDIAVMLTVGAHMEQHDVGLGAALPFIGATILIAALPLLLYLLFGKRAQRMMPRLRQWVNSHSWLVNIAACMIFIAVILS